jgi:mannose-6-phosphate isomerase-like protein (cupin superfamily)
LVSKDTAEHYIWGEVCDGWYLVNQPSRLTVVHERMPPGASEVRHYHREALQFFFVLSGVATLELDGRRIELRAHEGAEVPPLTPHQMRNLSDEPIEFLVVSQPNSRSDRVLVEAAEDLPNQ